jgi:hypothetical protein
MIHAILIDMHYMAYRSHHIEQITSAFTKQQWIKIKTLHLSQDESDDYNNKLDMTLENIDPQSATNDHGGDGDQEEEEEENRRHLQRRRLLRRRHILQPI